MRDIGKELEENVKKSWGKTLIVIPARMNSKRLPGKPLLMVDGQALVHWTYAQAMNTKTARVVVATPDREIGRYCQENDITWMATSEKHPNGTSRCWEIVKRSKVNFDVVIVWQVDEPCVSFEDVDKLIDSDGGIRTLVGRLCLQPDDPNVVKVVYSSKRCHWFSRAPMKGAGTHIGIYAFNNFTLDAVASLPPTMFAREENLEQLTWIESEHRIRPIEIKAPPLAINTQDDWEKFRIIVKGKKPC